jgi:hypothetical protein
MHVLKWCSLKIEFGTWVGAIALALAAVAGSGVGMAQDQACGRLETQITDTSNRLQQCLQESATIKRNSINFQQEMINAQKKQDELEIELQKYKDLLNAKTVELGTAIEREREAQGAYSREVEIRVRIGQERDRFRAEAENQKNRADTLDTRLREATASNPSLYSRIRELEGKLSEREAELVTQKQRADDAVRERADAQAESGSARDRLQKEQEDLRSVKLEVIGKNSELASTRAELKGKNDEVVNLKDAQRKLVLATDQLTSDLNGSSRTLGELQRSSFALRQELRTCQTAVPKACPEAGPALMACRDQLRTACAPDVGPASCASQLKTCQSTVINLRGASDAASVSLRELVEQDLNKRFVDLGARQSCENFAFRMDAGELVLMGKLTATGAKLVRDRAAEVRSVLPSLRVTEQLELISECPLGVDGWLVEQRPGGGARAMRLSELPRELRQNGDGLPTEGECEVLGSKLEQQRMIGIPSGPIGLWVRDSDGVVAMCRKQSNRWIVTPDRDNRYNGLVMRRGS